MCIANAGASRILAGKNSATLAKLNRSPAPYTGNIKTLFHVSLIEAYKVSLLEHGAVEASANGTDMYHVTDLYAPLIS